MTKRPEAKKTANMHARWAMEWFRHHLIHNRYDSVNALQLAADSLRLAIKWRWIAKHGMLDDRAERVCRWLR